jgi:cytochrome c-type biogenesis protein CcsB
MTRIIGALASLKLTVGLLMVILVVLATGTIIESLHGAEAARVVYYSPSFFILLGAFAVNLTASLIDRWPYGRYRIGYVITHASMLLILLGSLITAQMKIEGQLGLWEGEQSSTVLRRGAESANATFELPFEVRLDNFEIDVYPGTQRPAMFRSRVTVIDPSVEVERPAIIQMNQELAYGGFKFFQSSYQIRGDREMTVLSVSKDPGQAVVFIGYTLLIVGMMVVFATRMTQRRQVSRPTPPVSVGSLPVRAIMPVLMGVGLLSAAPSAATAAVDQTPIHTLRTLPVQHDGRVMPLDTLARESVWKVTGMTRWVREDPVATVLGWTFSPRDAAAASVVMVGDRDLAEAIGFSRRVRHASFNDFVNNQALRAIIDEARRLSQADRPISSVQEKALELEHRLVLIRGFFIHQSIRPLPVSEDPVEQWSVPDEMKSVADLVALKERLAASPPAHYPNPKTMAREVTYNRVRPTRLAWLLLIPISILAALSWRQPNKLLDRIAVFGLLAGFAVMTWGIAMRWQAAGRIPASNMYESLLFLAWGVGLFAFIAALFIRNRLVIFNAAAMSALVIFLADVLPIDPFIHPMPPVLAGTPWLAIHVPIIMVSYSLLALAALVAHMRVGLEIFSPGRTDAAAMMDETHYWYVQAGSILLIAGILTGSIWAASSWGRYWGWDPKEVWSLIAFLAYMAILHGRMDRWLGPVGAAAASIMAFGTILMTYIGVNYVLAAGLHSYGFGGSKVAKWLALVAVVEVAFVAAGLVAHRRNRGATGGPDAPTPLTIGEAES